MNIFLVDVNPDICARALCDLRLNKMILETAQLLSASHRHWFNDDNSILYKDTHLNHPCAIWLRQDINNHKWLLNYFQAIYEEKLTRSNKKHLSYLKLQPILYADIDYTQYPRPNFTFNCSSYYPSTNNVFEDYKKCLINKWLLDKREPTWLNSMQPKFVPYNIPKARQILHSLGIFQAPIEARRMLVTGELYG